MRKIITENESNNILRRVVDVLFGIFAFIIATRFILKLFGANSANNFVSFMYDLSIIFVAPFRGIFPDYTIRDMIVFETSSVIALIVVSIIYGLITMLFARGRFVKIED